MPASTRSSVKILSLLPIVSLLFVQLGIDRCYEECPEESDCDGWSIEDGDCDDSRSDVYPGAPELCDGIDNDCDGTIDLSEDLDADGYLGCEGGVTVDCDDENAAVYPGAVEVCDALDNDCNGTADEGCP